MDKRQKIRLLRVFEELYPNPESELNFKGDFQLVTSVILSAQTTDKKVNEVTPALFKKFPTFKALSKAEVGAVEEIIRPLNYYRTKARNIIAMAGKVMTEFGGNLPITHDELTSLPGVGRKTANVVLGEKRVIPTFAVDTHVFRVSRRLGLTQGEDPIEVEEDMMRAFDPATWRDLHHWLIFHGRRVCIARNPQCSVCAVADLCPSRAIFEDTSLRSAQ
jgi:endonuclease III